MGKKDVARRDAERLLTETLAMRRAGWPFGDVARRLGITVIEAQEYARAAYSQMATETAEEVRTAIEDRLDSILRLATEDLRLAESQSERTGLMRLMLAVESQRARLLGANIPHGTPDAEGDGDA